MTLVSSNNRSSSWIKAGWFLWTLSAFGIVLQIMMLKDREAKQVARFLTEAADEDDKFFSDTVNSIDDGEGFMWYQLEDWVNPKSLVYDIIEGFLYVADAFFISWVLWGCLVHCGVLPDERLDRKRRLRRLRDGRGVFSPIRNFDPLESSDDDESRDSMEYGDLHEEEEYGEVDVHVEEEKIKSEAEQFFRKGDIRKSKNEQRKKKIDEAGPMEDGILLLDFEMAPAPQKTKGADVVFL